jgi:hypothetical protein
MERRAHNAKTNAALELESKVTINKKTTQLDNWRGEVAMQKTNATLELERQDHNATQKS